VQPASPEVISSLITSLSIISSPANQLFEQSSENLSIPISPAATQTSFNVTDRHMYSNGSNGGGSFGIDYGAFKQPSHNELPEIGSLDELAASPPVIRTAKPPSGFSPLTAPPKSPKDPSGGIKSFLRGTSRPSSKGSNDRDDASSIGNVSVEPGTAPHREVRRMSSSDSWGKKQGRNSKGLMYMSSKERLRESAEKKRANVATGGVRGLGVDRVALPQFDSDSFMAELPINEETYADTRNAQRATDSPGVGGVSPALSSGSQGGIGSGRYIPARESSLRNQKKRSSNRTSRHDGKREPEENGETIKEVDENVETPPRRSADRRRRDRLDLHADPNSKFQQPLSSPPMQKGSASTKMTSKQDVDAAKLEQRRLLEAVEGAPSPAVAQRKSRILEADSRRSSSKDRKNGRQTPEPLKREGSRLKRLSAPLSPTNSDGVKRLSQANSRKGMTSPEPGRPQITVDDRPTSADSIDDAVDAYLCSPRLSQKIRHPQTGRTISFSEVGDSEGFAVFCCVGMGLTRYITAFYDELALTLKLRLITPDRPGVGDSEPYTDGTATPLSWPGNFPPSSQQQPKKI
jgi:hypothetical protein